MNEPIGIWGQAWQEFDRHEELDGQYRKEHLDKIISKIRDGIISVLGLDERAVKGYLTDNASTVEIQPQIELTDSNIYFGLLGNGITYRD